MRLLALILTLFAGVSCAAVPPEYGGTHGQVPYYLAAQTPAIERPADLPEGAPFVPVIEFTYEVDSRSVGFTIDAIRQANAQGADAIVIEFNTPGGSVDDGFLLTKAIERSKAPVFCIVDGMGASMGFYMLQGCADRAMTFRSTLMAHEPALSGNVSGNQEEFGDYASYLAATTRAMNFHMSARMCITYEEFSLRISGRDWWMDAVEALNVCAVDTVVRSTDHYVDAVKVAVSQAHLPR